MNYLALIGISLAIILAAIGAFFAYRCYMLWRHINISSLGIATTRSRSFLSNNFRLTLIIGGLASLHLFFEIWKLYDAPSTPFIWTVYILLYYLNLIVIMFALLIMAIMWYKLLSTINKWDNRMIKP